EEDPEEDPEEEPEDDDDDMEMDDEVETKTPPTSLVIPDADGQSIPPIASFG
nr:hypothetical protein [Tanacetum cinerariifolium]